MTENKKNRIGEIWNTIKHSFKGENDDYTKIPINKAVVLLAIPMILELSLESIFALVDIFFVSKLGQNAIVAVGLTEAAITILYSLAMGISTAAAALVARRIGEKNQQAASNAGAQSLIIALIMTVVISILGVVFAGDILSFMGASNEVIQEGTVFTRIMFGGSFAIMLLFLINGIFRGAGNAVMAMRSLWIASIANIILCPIFIHYFGLKGAAIATVIGRSLGVIYQCYHLFNGRNIFRFNKESFRLKFDIIKSIISIGRPATFQFILASGSWIVLARLIAETGGTEASAGYQIAIRNIIFFILPAWGLSNAAATLVGQNLGANEPERAEKSVLITTKYNIIFMGIVSLIFIIFAHPIISFFTPEPNLIYYGALSLQIMASGYIFLGIGMILTQALNGAGDTKTPTMLNFICFWLIQIPLSYLLAEGIGWGAIGAVIAVPISEIVMAGLAYYYFKKGKWKQIKV